MTTSVHLTQQPAWQALERHYEQIKDTQLRELFAGDAQRGEKLTAEGAGLFLDYSKNRVSDETLLLLLQLARETGVEQKRDAMFAGEKINVTEGRAVLHTALRVPKGGSVMVDGVNVVPEVHRGARQDGGLRRADSRRKLAGLYRQTHQKYRQHRHRRLGPRPGDGLRGAEVLQPARPHRALRV